MRAKDYFRSLALHYFGFSADENVIKIHNYIEERLSDLNQYITNEYPDYIFYGKSKDKLIIEYNSKNEYISLYYDTFTKKLVDEFNLQRADIKSIVVKYVVDTLQIKVNNIIMDKSTVLLLL